MIIAAIAFYIFAAVLIGSAALVVSSRNPVHSVLFLILAFFNAAALFLLAGAEFLAMILVIVYVGAVAVLFLFVVMMLDVNFDQLREGFQRYAPIGAAVGAVLFLEVVVTVAGWQFVPTTALHLASATPAGVSNTAALGQADLHELRVPVPGVRLDPAGGDDRRHRADPPRRGRGVPPAEHHPAAVPHGPSTLEIMTVSLDAGTRARRFPAPAPGPVPAGEQDELKPEHAHPGEHG